ncbi:MAG: acetylglutamate kinase [Clostridiales bacterium]|nr:acetylglutamate kinase [Clostridiales bacterium]HAW15471.1 acetylglutamate kinase [Clostridiales bacterium]
MQNKIDRASILIDALPYMKKLRGQTIVIKYGGNAMVNEDLKQSVMDDITLLKYIGINPILVHGGGPDINEMLGKMNIESHFVNGLRYTDEKTMRVAQMVLIGKTNKEIVSNLNSKGAKAIGICGIDGNLIEAEKMTTDKDGNEVDVGFVGKIKKINTKVIEMLASDEYIPVIAPIGVGENGESYNINADTVAAEVAVALKASKLITLTDVPGVLDNEKNLISILDEDSVKEYIDSGAITGGMIPKIQGCLDTVSRGVRRAHIIDGRIPHSMILEIFTSKGIGTMILKERGNHQ